MEIEKLEYKEINEIGYYAKKIDLEMTLLERMKIKKSTIKKIIMALGVYLTMMFLFFYIL